MVKKLLKTIIGLFWGKKLLQPVFERLFYFSLRGMNIGGGSFLQDSGEEYVLGSIIRNYKSAEKDFVLFDVGANTGDYTLMAHRLLKHRGLNTKIFAFEPSVPTFKKLGEKISNLKGVTANCLGLGASEASATLYFDEVNSGMASLFKRDMSYFKIDFSKEEQVSITTLDKFCQANGVEKINFLKLDVEGNEMEVLKGAKGVLEKGAIDFIQFEFGGADIDSRVYLRDFINLLKKDFTIFRILKNGLRQLNYSEFFEIFVTTNFLAVKKGILI